MPTTDPMPRFQASFTEIVVRLLRAPFSDFQLLATVESVPSSKRTAENSRDACDGPGTAREEDHELVRVHAGHAQVPDAASAVQFSIVVTPLKAGVSELIVPVTTQRSPQSAPFWWWPQKMKTSECRYRWRSPYRVWVQPLPLATAV
jgi:hypothetical protein